MARYLVSRCLLIGPLLLGAALLIFLAGHYAPGDPVQVLLGDHYSPDAAAQMRSRLGLDRPVSRNEMCRGVDPAAAASPSWLRPRSRRHWRSRAPKGLAGRPGWPLMPGRVPARRAEGDSLPRNRLKPPWRASVVVCRS